MVDKNKVNIVNELLKNTKKRPYEESLMIRYLESLEKGSIIEDDEQRFNSCIQFLIEDNFNPNGWQLDDIPIFYAHYFWNTDKKQAFILAVLEVGEVNPRYLDKDANEQEAEFINEAIGHFDISDYLKAGR